MFLGLLGTTSTLTVAGCTGAGTTFEAETALASESAASQTGYSFSGTEEQRVTRDVSGQEVTAVNKISTYEKTLSLSVLGEAKLGVFATVSTPAIDIAGRTFNPVGEYDTSRLVRLLQSNYESINSAERVDQQEVPILGASRTVDEFAATSTFEGQEIDVSIHITRAIRHEADFLIPIGVYPQPLGVQERDNVFTLMQNIVHPASN